MPITDTSNGPTTKARPIIAATLKRPDDFIEPDRQEFTRQLPKSTQILDCGCGPGMDTEKFSQLGYRVTAIDLSERFVRLTKKRVLGATVRKMDMRFLDFPSNA